MKTKNNLILSGGWAHNFAASVPNLVETLNTVGFASDVAFDVSESTELLESKNYDLITVLACWFQMKDARYSQQNREIWSRTTTQQWREAMLKQKSSGAGLMAMHTATICFDDWNMLYNDDLWYLWCLIVPFKENGVLDRMDYSSFCSMCYENSSKT